MCYSVCAAVLLCAAGSTEVCLWTFLRESATLYVPFYVNVLLCMCRSAAVCGRKHGGIFLVDFMRIC
jgi:hypothetical protein